ncbi:MAG: hypothetical protein R3E90_10530 [Marinicella sp.]
MTLCPYALVSSCAKCPIVKVCLLKGVIGDHPKKAAGKSKEESQDAPDKD